MARITHWELFMKREIAGTPQFSGAVGSITAALEADRDWIFVLTKLERLLPYVFELRAISSSETIVLSGSVMSEEIKDVIEEVFRDYDPIARLMNVIEVTAPFRSADRDDDGFEAEDLLPKDNVVVDRYPQFDYEERPSVGERFRFKIDLTSVANDQPPFRMELPTDWSVVTVDARIISAQLRFADGADRRKIVVERDGRSIPAQFEAEVVGITEGGLVEVQAVFNCRGRFSGIGKSLFKLAERTGDRPQTPPSGTGAVSLSPTTPAPDLTIQILNAGTAISWMWVLDAPRARNLGKPARTELVTLGDPEGFATGLLSKCPNLKEGRHQNVMRGIGEQIWAATPETFRILYRDMRQAFGPAFPIQIVTNEPHVPWEMMYPDAQSGIAKPDHLFMTHPVSRWYASLGGRLMPDFQRGSIASFVPDYKKGRPPLPAAIEEGKWLVSTLGAERMDPTWENFTTFWSTRMPDERVAVLHFAGHGENEPTPRIRLLSDEFVSCDEVNGSVMLGRRDQTFVVLNACETGAGKFKLGLVSGWAASLTENEFGGVLAPLWKVEDECASQVVRKYLQDFCKGVPIGIAMQRARVSQREASPTAFAYVCHGDVNARMR